MDILKGLNPKQREAVEQTEGPLLILAGAGSGKTKTLTHRIAYLIAEKHVAPYNILAVTFTNKAAGEMRQRLGKLLGQDGEDRRFMPYMGTFHSIAVKLLRIYGDNIKVPNNFVILDETDKLGLIKRAMKQLNIDPKQYNPKTVASLISSAKNDGVDERTYADIASSPIQKKTAKVYKVYVKLCTDNSSLDFDDLLLKAVELLSVKPVRQELQNKFHYVLIDEYQDTNKVQYQFVKQILNKNHNICVVGDDWQSIYSWRGADFTNILNFERDFSGATIIKLEQNYRSTQHILDAAHKIITKNQNRSEKELWTDKNGGKEVGVLAAKSERHEAEMIANTIYSQVSLRAREFSDFAVLYRTNAQSRVIEEIFLQNQIPYKIVGGVRFYDRAEIKDLIAYLRLIYQPDDLTSFNRIVNVPKRGLGEASVGKFLDGRGQTDLITALISAEQDTKFTPRARKEMSDLGKKLSSLRDLIDTIPIDELVQKIIRTFKYEEYLNDGTIAGEARVENVQELLSVAKNHAGLSVEDFLTEVALVSGADESADGNVVTLMTVHAAKGLEFPVVIVAGMEETVFPHSRAFYEPEEMEEERRLAYVAMTRAMDELYLSYAQQRMLFGQFACNQISRFIEDIGMTPASADNDNWVENEPQYEPSYEPDEVEAKVGDQVRHQIFGDGAIEDIDGSVVTINFSGKVRKLNAAFAPLEKL
ncbi:MAG: UvrD-helicase domain-containing protein [Candidatus Nomurabacteria bacterium]|jgi:DNA helicase-2/ATP-dependent DNA helicase PcrA|nr:UvrD-helicase domain-containing protein [Candidatus Nomurabacteria bacterium]